MNWPSSSDEFKMAEAADNMYNNLVNNKNATVDVKKLVL